MEYVCYVLCRGEDRMQDSRDRPEVCPKSCRYDDCSFFVLIIDIPYKCFLDDPSIRSRDFSECSVCFGGDWEWDHERESYGFSSGVIGSSGSTGVSGSTGTSGVSGMIGTITPSTNPNSVPCPPATAWLGIRAM